jgi:hypothetical protein
MINAPQYNNERQDYFCAFSAGPSLPYYSTRLKLVNDKEDAPPIPLRTARYSLSSLTAGTEAASVHAHTSSESSAARARSPTTPRSQCPQRAAADVVAACRARPSPRPRPPSPSCRIRQTARSRPHLCLACGPEFSHLLILALLRRWCPYSTVTVPPPMRTSTQISAISLFVLSVPTTEPSLDAVVFAHECYIFSHKSPNLEEQRRIPSCMTFLFMADSTRRALQ